METVAGESRSYFDPGSSVWWYIVRMGLTSLLPSLAFSAVVFGVLGAWSDAPDEFGPEFEGTGLLVFFGLVVVSPVLETMLMSPILWALSYITRKPVLLALLSAGVWGAVHSLAAPAWGLVIAWPFYVFSRAYLAWRPYGWWKAVGVTASIHAFQNLLPGLAAASL
jgi:hypothetical protein